MPTLQHKRLRGDMIEVYKIINGIYDHKVVIGFFELSDVEQTRGHNKKLRKLSCKINQGKKLLQQQGNWCLEQPSKRSSISKISQRLWNGTR